MIKYLYIRADYNDGDYVTQFNPVSEKTEEFVRKVSPIFDRHNGRVEDIKQDPEFRAIMIEGKNLDLEDDDDFDEIDDYVEDGIRNFLPSAPYEGEIHTIENIKIYHIEKIENLV